LVSIEQVEFEEVLVEAVRERAEADAVRGKLSRVGVKKHRVQAAPITKISY